MRLVTPIAMAFLVIVASQVRAGDNQPAEVEVRKAVARSLPFLEKEGLAWIKKHDCMTCHHVPFLLWSHNEAKAHGISVDEKKLAEWTEWSMNKSLAARVFFKLSDKTLPESLQPKLQPLLAEGFTQEKDFVAAIAKVLTAAELKEHQASLVKQAAAPKKGGENDGGGLDTMTQLLLGRGPPANEKSDPFYAGTAEFIFRWQEADGSWTAAGQLPSRNWSKPAANQTTTLWTIFALTAYDTPSAAVKKSIERAHAFVAKAKPDPNLEWLAARLLYEHKFGTAKSAAILQEQLRKRQNEDGGWSALPAGKSEAFSTGQSLYALRLAGVAADDAALRQGQRYLLDTQTDNGSWSVAPNLLSKGGPDRLKRIDPIYRYWGTAWASIGLSRMLANLPPKETPPKAN